MSGFFRWAAVVAALLLVVGAAGVFAMLSVPSLQDAVFERVATAALGQNRDALMKDDALRAVVCGSSSPLTDPSRAKSCIAVIAGGKIYFVDTGPQSYGKVAQFRLPVERIGAVFFTHFHSDHVADLGEFNMNSWGLGRSKPLDVYGPPGVERVVAGFQEAYALDEGYRIAHHGADFMPPDIWKMVAHPVAMPGEPTPAPDRTAVVFDDGQLKVTAIEVNHEPVEPAYGYRFDYKGRSIVISGDTRKHEPLAKAAAGADVLFHEGQAQHMVKTLQAIAAAGGQKRLAKILGDIPSYHTSPVQAAEIANEAKVKLLVLTHLTPPIVNIVAERIYTRGLSEARKGDWAIAHDGTLIELPIGSGEVRQDSIN
jgi:ribonuclease Z